MTERDHASLARGVAGTKVHYALDRARGHFIIGDHQECVKELETALELVRKLAEPEWTPDETLDPFADVPVASTPNPFADET
jgi:hypothetical protein